MRRLALLFASLLALGACSKGERLVSFQCSPKPGPEAYEEWLELNTKEFEEAESLEAFHREIMPWVFDKETGDLYDFDSFREAFVPVKNADRSSASDTYSRSWEEYSGRLSKSGKILKIRTVGKTKNALIGEKMDYDFIHNYDIESNTIVHESDAEDAVPIKCMLIPTTGIDVQWAGKKG